MKSDENNIKYTIDTKAAIADKISKNRIILEVEKFIGVDYHQGYGYWDAGEYPYLRVSRATPIELVGSSVREDRGNNQVITWGEMMKLSYEIPGRMRAIESKETEFNVDVL